MESWAACHSTTAFYRHVIYGVVVQNCFVVFPVADVSSTGAYLVCEAFTAFLVQ